MAEVEDGDGGGDEDGVEDEDEEYEVEQIVSKNVPHTWGPQLILAEELVLVCLLE